ncbi:MAG TPA: ABC transporter ATP-binding protein [Solirubrobacterales bacterium]|nr:ABC transporter ATP-binding protein [Solirubrobacterales bacterium]
MERLEAAGVGFGYGEEPVVDSFGLVVEPGEMLCLVGRTGVGKTTVAKLLAGILAPDEGEVSFGGRAVAGLRDVVSFVFQQGSLLPWRSVADNVALALEIDRVPKAERRRQVEELLAKVGLSGYEDFLPAQISGGMRQRAAVARAFASPAPILIMDEPFGALDAQTRIRLEEELLRLWEEDRRTIVFLTNDHDEALVLGDRIVGIGGPPARIGGTLRVPLSRPRSNLDDEVVALRSDVRELLTAVPA